MPLSYTGDHLHPAAETLNQGNCVGVSRGFCMTRFLTYMRGDGAIDDAQGLAHDRRLAGKQKPQLIGDAQHPLAHRFLQ